MSIVHCQLSIGIMEGNAVAQNNLAYDLSAYAPKQDRQKKSDQARLKMVKRGQGRAAVAFTPRVVAAFALVVVLTSLIVYNQVALNEVTGEISRLNREIAIMESDSTRLASLLESTISLRAIAQQAEEELGMVRRDQFQTRYVYLFGEDQIILREGTESQAQRSSLFGRLISQVTEYFGAS